MPQKPLKPPEPNAPDRTCSTCGQQKPAGDFARTGYAGKGYQKKCRTCAKAKVPDPHTCRRCHSEKPPGEFPKLNNGRCWTCYDCLNTMGLPGRPPQLSPACFSRLRRGLPMPVPRPVKSVPVDSDLPNYDPPTPEELKELDDCLDHPEICPKEDQDTIDANCPEMLEVLPDQCCYKLRCSFRLTKALLQAAQRIIKPGGSITQCGVSSGRPRVRHTNAGKQVF